MTRKAPSSRDTLLLRDWIVLQQRLATRAASYLEEVGQLVGSGSLEPREYLEQSAKAWGDWLGEWADWTEPEEAEKRRAAAKKTPKRAGGRSIPGAVGQEPIRCAVTRRLDSRPIPIPIGRELFQGAGRAAWFRLTIDGFSRKDKTGTARRPAIPIQPEVHFRLDPNVVSRTKRRRVELKIYSLPDNLRKDDVYEGVLWATDLSNGASGRLLVTTIELTIV